MRMKNLCVAMLLVGLSVAGTIVVTTRMQSAVAAEREEPKGDHWRNHDGHWSYWCEADKRWYYTDGTHWFWHDGKVWVPYRFDRKFGHGESFVHGDYKPPHEKARVVLPVHEVFHRR